MKVESPFDEVVRASAIGVDEPILITEIACASAEVAVLRTEKDETLVEVVSCVLTG
jgi:hypothetical protein